MSLLDRSHRGHLGKKVLQQSLQCLLVHARAVFPGLLLALLAPAPFSRLGFHDLSMLPIVCDLSGFLLLAIGRSPRASLFPQPLLVLVSPPFLPRPHFFFILHPLVSFFPIHFVSIVEVPRPLLESHSLPIVLVARPPPFSLSRLLRLVCPLHRQTNKQKKSHKSVFFLVTPVYWGPRPKVRAGFGSPVSPRRPSAWPSSCEPPS